MFFENFNTVVILINSKNTIQARRKVWNSGGARSTVVGIICPPGWDRVNCLAKNWGGLSPPSPTAGDSPDYFIASIFLYDRTSKKIMFTWSKAIDVVKIVWTSDYFDHNISFIMNLKVEVNIMKNGS